MTDLYQKLHNYVDLFNRRDEECYQQLISNAQAEEFLAQQIPLLECPDAVIEKTYYFRWWTFRKHWKDTEKGHVLTEFLPPVKWAGPYNTIVCPACFHIREGRWLRDPEGWLKEYISFWLEGHGHRLKYSSWLVWAVWEYCSLKNDFAYAVEMLPRLVEFFEEREAIHRRSCGLYWSNDNRDGMEYSISGPGLRPTMNSYVYGDARTIAKIAALAGDRALQARFTAVAEQIKSKMDALLWHNDFYRVLPMAVEEDPALTCRPAVDADHDVREEVGFIPWYFGIPAPGKDPCFAQLLDSQGFRTPVGIATAEQRHPRFLEAHTHECLWNGYVWPFATSQTLVAVANLLRSGSTVLTKEAYYELLHQYAVSHRMTLDDGTEVPYIDEVLHPYTGIWSAREQLKDMGWLEKKGGYERGKDYNHSLFCDLVLSGLLGIGLHDGQVTANPLVPDCWEYFRVENLWLGGKRYSIYFDKTGSRYNMGPGLHIVENEI